MSEIKPVETLSNILRASVNQANWLKPSDAAAVELALHLARSIEAMDPESRSLAPTATTLHKVLVDLGLTPKSQREEDQAGVVSWLDELRERRAQAASGGRNKTKTRNT